MGIEKNQEEVLVEIQTWIIDVLESLFAWIVEGERRMKDTGIYIENDLGWLEICLEMMREEILGNKGTDQGIKLLGRAIHLKRRVELLTSVVREYLKEIEYDHIAVVEELKSFVSMDDTVEAWSRDPKDEEGSSSKQLSSIDFAHNKVNEEETWSISWQQPAMADMKYLEATREIDIEKERIVRVNLLKMGLGLEWKPNH